MLMSASVVMKRLNRPLAKEVSQHNTPQDRNVDISQFIWSRANLSDLIDSLLMLNHTAITWTELIVDRIRYILQ